VTVAVLDVNDPGRVELRAALIAEGVIPPASRPGSRPIC
jgi:hypothetical protein